MKVKVKRRKTARATPPAAGSWVPYAKLVLWDDNPRDNDDAVPKVAESIKRFGFIAPVVVWTSKNQLVAGHTRLKALGTLLGEDPTFTPPGAPGPGLVPTRYHEFTSAAEASAYAIADNRLNYEADWDYAKLAPMLASFQAVDPTLLGSTGFDPGELDALLGSKWSPEFIPPTAGADEASSSGEAGLPRGSHVGARTIEFTEAQWAYVVKRVQSSASVGVREGDLAAGLVALLEEFDV